MVIIQNTSQILQQKKIHVVIQKKKTKREDNAGYLKVWQEQNPDSFKKSQKKYDQSEKGKQRHIKAQARYKRKLKKKEAHRLRNLKFRLKNPDYWKNWHKENPNKLSEYQSKYDKTEKGKIRHRKAQAKYVTTPKGKKSINRKKQKQNPTSQIIVLVKSHN